MKKSPKFLLGVVQLLEIKNVSVTYEKMLVLQDINIKVSDGEIIGIIGPNGAGKTTLLRSIIGVVKIFSGDIFLNGKKIDNLPVSNRIKMGIAMSPERGGFFPAMSVRDNLLLGAYVRSSKDDIKKDLEMVFSLFPILENRKKQLASTLSGGEQKMLSIAKALMARPRVLLLDEPSSGIAPRVKARLTKWIRRLNQSGITILLAEQDARMTFDLANKIYVLEHGRIALYGDCSELKNIDHLREHYVGR